MTTLTIGITAHVDAGKTTLAEALLYQAGVVRQLGRVDKGDAFLDPETLERQRGITIFAHQAMLQVGETAVTLLDTPGHADFGSQTEQVLRVLDAAVLVVAATDGVPAYTRTLMDLLARYQVPTVVFVNKMDVPGADRAQVLSTLQAELHPGCLDFTAVDAAGTLSSATEEALAVLDDTALTTYLETGTLSDQVVRQLVQQRQAVPVYFGSALHLEGTTDLLAGLARWVTPLAPKPDFGARVFKISHDGGERLTWLRVTGGTLHAKDQVLPEQKVQTLRCYNGRKFTAVATAPAGTVCAVTGLSGTYPGQGLGQLPDAPAPVLQPVLTYALDPLATDILACRTALMTLADEEPQLQVVWSEARQELRLQVMGPMQVEVLTQVLASRFGLTVAFSAGSILYKETLAAPVEGVGHFEPLRHYAEVHLRLAPGPRGSGVHFDSDCSLEVLPRNWQHQVLTSLAAKQHLGVLTGAPLTDVQITLVSGKASNVHSVGGDFREATWRAVRQGLMMAQAAGESVLLEPWYAFRLLVPQAQVGRAMTDIQQMHGEINPPEMVSDTQVRLTGRAPVAQMRDYAVTVRAYTHGQGALECTVSGYDVCQDAAAVIAAADYLPTGDLPNTPDSVFCKRGAGYPVPWDRVPEMAHVPYQDI